MRLGSVADQKSKDVALGKGLILGFVIASTAIVTYQIVSWSREKSLLKTYQLLVANGGTLPEDDEDGKGN